MSKWSDRLLVCFSWIATLTLLSIAIGILAYVVVRGAVTIDVALFFGDVPPADALLGRRRVFDGILPALVGTCMLVVGASFFAVPLGLASGVWLAEYGTGPWGRRFSMLTTVLAGVPSIIMGLFGFGTILLLRRTLLPNANLCLLLSMACLALLVLPYLIRATETSLSAIPPALRIVGPSLGFSRWQSIWHVHLPAARRGIQSGIALAVGRIAEDTAVILMTGAVVTAGIPGSLTDQYEALPFTIYYRASDHRNQTELDQAFGAALILLCVSLILLGVAFGLAKLARRSE